VEIDVEAVRAMADPFDGARSAGDLISRLQGISTELGVIRRAAVEELLADGLTQAQVAVGLNLTRARVGQILKSGPGPERMFLGAGALTVVVAGKVETGRRDPQPVVAQDDLVAYDRLSALARASGLDTCFEVTPPNGFIRLNRDNLIVLCGPLLTPADFPQAR
jgi:hypothetical protein